MEDEGVHMDINRWLSDSSDYNNIAIRIGKRSSENEKGGKYARLPSIKNHMSQFVRFGVQITFVFRILADMERDTFDDIDACIFQRLNFSGLLVSSLTAQIFRWS